ncbi:hypothetical protein [Acinetobacter modestus]|uniref:hypothetical protein n=1 Tax=Acinetobacter modestus TaxID=1776740 RepID=UPI001F4BC993|nr:hypothetical protein [Acinetobacter modestus]MCH7332266.1 hypothetical protein [Acinetobacter modestus]
MYILNSNIKVGDIILVRGAAKHSKIIAKLTNGHFSHAMIALENGVCLEAITGTGVQRTSQSRIGFHDKANVIVLRCLFPDEQTALTTYEYISKNSAKYQGNEYSYRGAIESIATNDKDHTNGGYFCSHLVAAIFADAGFPLLDRPVHKITPNQLLESHVLENITDQIVTPISDVTKKRMEKNGDKFNCIDAGGSTLSQDAKNHRKLLNDTAKYFRRNKIDVPNRPVEFVLVLTDPLNQDFAKELDYQISKTYKKIGINEYVHQSFSHADYEADLATFADEVHSFGYTHALNLYGNFNYLLMTQLAKRHNAVIHNKVFEDSYQKFKFRYCALKLEYYSTIIGAIDEMINHFIDIIRMIENKFPEHNEELQQIKATIIINIIDEQKDDEIKSALMNFLKV